MTTPFILLGDLEETIIRPCIQWVWANRANPIEILLSSPGGDIGHSMALYAAIVDHPEDVTVTVIGSAESCGALILQAADVRRIHHTAYVMIHRGASEQGEISPDEAETTAVFNRKYYDYIDEIIYQRMRKSGCRMSRKKYQELVRQAAYFTAHDAVKVGLADEVTGE